MGNMACVIYVINAAVNVHRVQANLGWGVRATNRGNFLLKYAQ